MGLAESTLAKMRLTGSGPAFLRVGSRRVMYALEDINAWLSERKCTSTSEYAA
jgi:predicted DNA-binding transcriptional regulator AlpA